MIIHNNAHQSWTKHSSVGLCRLGQRLSTQYRWKLLTGKRPSWSCGGSLCLASTYALFPRLKMVNALSICHNEVLVVMPLLIENIKCNSSPLTFCLACPFLLNHRSACTVECLSRDLLCREGAEAARALLREMADGLQDACKQAGTDDRQEAMEKG